MQKSRRDFLCTLPVSTALSSAFIARVTEAGARLAGPDPEAAARDEDYWSVVQDAFSLDRRFVNLAASSASPPPRSAHEQLIRDLAYVDANSPASIASTEARATIRVRIARMANVAPEEIALVRNATEGLHTVIRGVELKPGDEVLSTTHDYNTALNAWRQRERRDGIVLRLIRPPFRPESHDQLVELFEKAITPKTKLIMLCDIVWINGQIYPVDRVCKLAHERGIQTLVDGAHGFGHIHQDLAAIGCDYYTCSLHKWISAPLGNGFLYVRRERIGPLWPLYSPEGLDPHGDQIQKLEDVGTTPPIIGSIGPALDLHQAIGQARKRARLHYLKRSWVDRLADVPRVRILTNPAPESSCGIAFVEVEGVDRKALASTLFREHRIKVGTITYDYEDARGIYVGVQVFTRPSDLDVFVDVVTKLAR
jgi:isopenicillin-N epimerase